jgi:hypothetical protein
MGSLAVLLGSEAADRLTGVRVTVRLSPSPKPKPMGDGGLGDVDGDDLPGTGPAEVLPLYRAGGYPVEVFR